tara:strand:+ start:5272 stop:5922 length:651 start_codon:yes stop_codon:yes gene_type:complete
MVSFNPDGDNSGAKKVFRAIQKTYDDNKALRILNELVGDLEMDDDSDTSYYDRRSGSADLRRQGALQEQLANMSESDKKEMYKAYAKHQIAEKAYIDKYRLGKSGPPGLGRQAAGYLKTAVPKAFEYIGAPLAAVTTAGEAASNKLIGPAATSMGSKALGFMANPWLAAMAGMFAPSQMDQNRSAEYEGSPMHQQWLARRGPLAKSYGKTSVYVSR